MIIKRVVDMSNLVPKRKVDIRFSTNPTIEDLRKAEEDRALLIGYSKDVDELMEMFNRLGKSTYLLLRIDMSPYQTHDGPMGFEEYHRKFVFNKEIEGTW